MSKTSAVVSLVSPVDGASVPMKKQKTPENIKSERVQERTTKARPARLRRVAN
jgi:hypothetical protein